MTQEKCAVSDCNKKGIGWIDWSDRSKPEIELGRAWFCRVHWNQVHKAGQEEEAKLQKKENNKNVFLSTLDIETISRALGISSKVA